MKIAIFQTGPLVPGGTEYVVHHSANRLAELGHDVVVFAGKSLFGPHSKAIFELCPHGYRIYEFTCPIVKGLSRPWAKWNLLRAVKSLGCEIVHAHTLHTSGHIAVSLRRLLNVPVLVTGHGEDIQVDRELGYGYRLKKRHDLAVRRTLRQADGATGISRDMVAEMLTAGARQDRTWLVPNGIDPALLLPAKPLVRTKPYVLAMGRLVPKKGFDVLLRAFADVRRDGSAGCDLLLAGNGPERTRLEALTHELGIEEYVQFMGYLNEEEKRSALAGAQLFICPSLREPFGIVNLEAMAAARAIVASDTDGIPDLIVPGRNGLLFPRGDSAALAAHIRTLLTNPDTARHMGSAGREMAVEYVWPRIARAYLEIYLELTERRRQNGRKHA